MPERRRLASARLWLARGRGAAHVLTAGGLALLGLTSGPVHDPAPRLVWNASASAPLGLYWLARGRPVERGALVLAWPPREAAALAAARGYLPRNVPLVKRVAAMPADVVCAVGGIVVINGRVAATSVAIDGAGRPLPAWRGCRPLRAGEAFLLMEGVSASFDGRYFGPVAMEAIVGRLVPLWTW